MVIEEGVDRSGAKPKSERVGTVETVGTVEREREEAGRIEQGV